MVDTAPLKQADARFEVQLASWYEQAAVNTWNDVARFNAAAALTPPEGTIGAQAKPRGVQVVYGSGACGGDLPPCSVLACESGGNLVAQNPHSTASGKWQILDSTWAGYGGYSRAMYAPEEVQDAKARQLWNGGAGRSQWVCR